MSKTLISFVITDNLVV